MIYNRPYIDLTKYIDLESFDSLHSEISRGIVTARPFIIDGNHKINPGSINPTGQGYKVKPLYNAYSEWESLPEDNPLKVAGNSLTYNQLTTYLKYAFGGYDLYSHYDVLEYGPENNSEKVGEHFPNLLKWILDFKENGIFSILHSATIFVLEAGGIPWEHYDPEYSDSDKDFIPEFIHIKTDIERPFYLFDPNTQTRTYINTRVAWWDERDWHGGEPINRSTYTLRINGRFTDSFKRKILE
jgi:hypothetical protein